MIAFFQFASFALITLSYVLIIAVPLSFFYSKQFEENKTAVFRGLGLWVGLVFLVGIFNSFVV